MANGIVRGRYTSDRAIGVAARLDGDRGGDQRRERRVGPEHHHPRRANERVGEVIEVVMGELRQLVNAPIAESELQRAKDNVKGGLLFGDAVFMINKRGLVQN